MKEVFCFSICETAYPFSGCV